MIPNFDYAVKFLVNKSDYDVRSKKYSHCVLVLHGHGTPHGDLRHMALV
jgi:hypothetical protein